MNRRALLIAGASLGSCGRSVEQPERAPAVVFAAASLDGVLREIGAAFATEGHPEPVLNIAASSVLARQIEQGARADIFLSADAAWMDHVAQLGLVAAHSRIDLLTNRLVLVAPASEPVRLEMGAAMDLGAALDGGRLAIADPDNVPAGRYAKAALETLGAWDGVRLRLARGDSVRTALRFVETGEAALGIVYATDAKAAAGRVQVVGTFPQGSHPPIVYPMALVRPDGGAPTDAARAFAAFLTSPAARVRFEAHGFGFLPVADD